MYAGANNSICHFTITQVVSYCDFDLKNFPFDRQLCNFSYVIDDEKHTDLLIKIIDYSFAGNKILSEYKVTNFQNFSSAYKEFSQLTFTIELENMYTYYLSSIYIPTSLILVISYFPFWFGIHDFSNRIMVSLTSLLVLSALFSQVSSSLPLTSYLKLIDLWCLFCIVISFIIICLLVLVNYVDKPIKVYTNDTNNWKHTFQNINFLNKAFKIIIGFLIIFFVIFYTGIVIYIKY